MKIQKNQPEKGALVSIIIPTFNAEPFIKKCLDSAKKQTHKNIEVLICDDCSTDNTKNIILQQKDKRFIYLRTKKNSGGPAVPRNLGIRKAKGKYIAFLDQDDSWNKNKLKKCVHKMQQGYQFCYHQLIYKNSKILKKHKIDITKNPLKFLLEKGPIPTTSGIVVCRKTIKKIRGFDECKNLIAGEDYDCWLRIAKTGAKFCFIKEPLGTYGKNPNRLTSPQKAIKILAEIKKRYFTNEESIPLWIHQSYIKNLLITNKIQEVFAYIFNNRKNIIKKLFVQ